MQNNRLERTDNPIEQHYRGCLQDMWKTRGARFNAFHRLKRLNNLSTFIVSMLSLYAIFLSIIPIFFSKSMNDLLIQAFSALSVLLSIFIIIISIMENGKNYSLSARELHSNALEISGIMSRLEGLLCRADWTPDQAQQFIDEYEKAISRVTDNHEPADYDMFKLTRASQFYPNTKWLPIRKAAMFMKYSLQVYWMHGLFLIAPPALTLIFYWTLQRGSS